ncbi:hypothetical protein ACET3Z_000705 [Daucus carota]
MSTVFNLPILSTAKCSHLYDVETLEATKVSFQATPTKKKAVPLSKSQWVKRDVKNLVVDNLDVVDETVINEANDDVSVSNDMKLLRFENQGFLKDEEIVNDEPTFTHTVENEEVDVNNSNGDAA